jgi:hypothetical protein
LEQIQGSYFSYLNLKELFQIILGKYCLIFRDNLGVLDVDAGEGLLNCEGSPILV